MANVTVSLPDPMNDWVQAQVKTGKYSSSSDYVQELIRGDQEVHEQQQVLQTAITQGLNSGISDISMEQLLKQARSKASSAQ